MKKKHAAHISIARLLRQRQTPAEHRLWAMLQNRQLLGYKFRRQHPIGPYVTDFYCAEAKLIIEVDGDIHAYGKQIQHDAERTQYLTTEGYRVIRFTNDEVLQNLNAVAEIILETLAETEIKRA